MCCFQGLEREESIPAENTSPRELGAACLHTLVEHSLSILCPGNWSGHRGQKLVEFCQSHGLCDLQGAKHETHITATTLKG